ncbi:type IV pilus biogenesis protein PilM [Leptospirillum ferriphilum]|uniref:type IV pilus biogenesis protein PilM n=1 Tax=Leptospirillum ferriphilum TaxID=178606 RepID=UPI0006B22EF8|nr:type IV pilus biogenesis protein PilM [Leptospirillum ferriphilum]
MYLLIFSLIAILAGGISWQETHNASLPSYSAPAVISRKGSQISTLFELYREAVNNYASANLSYSGTVSTGALSLPPGTIIPPNFSNTISGGTAWSWVSPGSGVSPAVLLSSLSGKSRESLLVGLNQKGTLYSPVTGPTGIPVPGAVPNGALVSLWEMSSPGPPPAPSGGPWPQLQSSTSSYNAYDGTTRNVCLSFRSYGCGPRHCTWHAHICTNCCHYTKTCYTCLNYQTQYQWASYSCTNYDWIFQPGGSPSDPSSSCTITNTWWEPYS